MASLPPEEKVILVGHSLDEPDLESIFFTDYGQKNDEIETVHV